MSFHISAFTDLEATIIVMNRGIIAHARNEEKYSHLSGNNKENNLFG